MKRLLSFLLILIFLPIVSFADDESLYVGIWCHTHYQNDGTLIFRLLELRDDHTSVIVFGKADGDDSKVPGRSFIGTWKTTSKGIHVITGYNTTKDLQYENGCLFEYSALSKDYYYRVSPESKNTTDSRSIPEQTQPFNDPLFDQKLSEGILLPAGNYIVGVDLPAGDYRADVVSDVGGVVTVYRSKEEAEKSPMSYINEINLGNMWGTLVFRLTLEDGYYVQLKYNSVKLYAYSGLLDMSTPKE